MLRNINGHTFDVDKISNSGWALDLGSRFFNDFRKPETFESFMLSKGLNVISVDPYKNMPVNSNDNCFFINKACIGVSSDENMLYYEYRDAGANSLYNKDGNHKIVQNKNSDFIQSYEVETITISEIMEQFDIEQFDVIKIDIEGGEYDILLNFPKNCTKQLSVEFHDWLGLNPFENTDDFYDLVESTTLIDYEPHNKIKTTMSNLYTYCDLLYILK